MIGIRPAYENHKKSRLEEAFKITLSNSLTFQMSLIDSDLNINNNHQINDATLFKKIFQTLGSYCSKYIWMITDCFEIIQLRLLFQKMNPISLNVPS